MHVCGALVRGAPRVVLAAVLSAVLTVGAVVSVALPANAVPDNPAAPAANTLTYRRVIPVPAGQVDWGTAFGAAGSMWSSGYHTGTDFPNPTGTAVLAAAEGIVVFVGNGGPYGNFTRVRHPDGVETWYAHQSAILTTVGSKVNAGQRIGLVGSTGNSTGPHLHFEVRIGGQAVDPRTWLSGATIVPGPSIAGTAFDPILADQIRADLTAAEDARQAAQVVAAAANAKAAAVTKKAAVAAVDAGQADAAVASYAREVYKTGIDPQWLLQADSLAAGNPQEFTDRQVYLKYTNNSQNKLLMAALAAAEKANRLRDEAKALAQQATDALSVADQKMALTEAQLAASLWTVGAGGSWDGVIPDGGSKAALAAVKFGLSQVGQPYTSAGGTGPEYGCNGFTWRAWDEAGSSWPLQTAYQQATNRRWVVPVPAGQEKPGDLIFWIVNNGTDLPGRIDHNGLVVNPSQGVFVHAGSTRVGVEINNYKTSSYYKTPVMFGRMIVAPDKPAKSPAPDKKPPAPAPDKKR